jgi:hypothetical protein
MDGIKQWAFCLMISAASATVLQFLNPRGSLERTLKTVIGVFLVSAVCMPFLNGDKFGISAVNAFEFEEFQLNSDGCSNIYIESAKTVVDTQVKYAADECGIKSYSVNSDISFDNYDCIIIHKIEVSVDENSREKLNRFTDVLKERLGVTVTVTQEKGGTNIENA